MRLRLKTKSGKRIEGSVMKRDEQTYEVSYAGKTSVFKVYRTPFGSLIIEDENGKKHKLSRIFSSKYERVIEIDDSIFNLEIVSPESTGEDESPDVALIKSSFSGSVRKVYVKKNDKVQKGQALLDLESMKMINTIKSPIDGIVEDLYISEGKNVMSGEKLVKIKSGN